MAVIEMNLRHNYFEEDKNYQDIIKDNILTKESFFENESKNYC
jgi:hypothetical protein